MSSRIIKRPDRNAPIEVRELDEKDSTFHLARDFGRTDFADTEPTQPAPLELQPIEERDSHHRAWRASRTVTNWALGALFCALLLAAQMLDQHDEEQAMADAAISAQQQAGAADAQARAAKALCEAELGPGTRVLWTTDGDLVCRPVQVVADGGRHQ